VVADALDTEDALRRALAGREVEMSMAAAPTIAPAVISFRKTRRTAFR